MDFFKGLIVIIIMTEEIYAEEDLFYNNGWKPITNERVLQNLQRNFIRPPSPVHSTASWNPIARAEENIVHLEQNAAHMPLVVNRGVMSEGYVTGRLIDEMPSQMDIIDEQQNNKEELLISGDIRRMQKPRAMYQRKAKKMLENQEVLNNIDVGPGNENYDVHNNVQQDTHEGRNDNYHIYEVTEDTEASEIKDLIDINQHKVEKLQTHFEPPFIPSSAKNLSNVLFSILGNYNIRINDDLSNYAMSRSKYNSNSLKQGYVYPAPGRVTPMRNSVNHFPIDPLLAVLLSNYGYYLPGFYGFPGNYYNIYGYLASNNIHNNKPFGSYKIYSDTDSYY